MSTNHEYEKKSNPLLWIGIGCGGCLCVVVLLVVVAGVFLYRVGTNVQKAMEDLVENSKGVPEAQQIGLALHNYFDVNKKFPPAYTTDADGKPLHSWRVLLLPLLGESELYSKIRLDEPWDSEHNFQFHTQMPSVFRGGFDASPASTGYTNFAWVVGPNTISDGPNSITFQNITDGTATTAVLFETRRTISWMSPLDLTMEDLDKGIGTDNAGPETGIASHILPKTGEWVSIVGLADGSVLYVQPTVPVQVLRDAVTINDGKTSQLRDYATNPEEEIQKALEDAVPFLSK